jgi:hypothetical protein
MNYSRIYDQLIQRGQARQAGLSKSDIVAKMGYVERHHIIPRSMAGTNHSTNLVYLTPEEHYFAHGLLVKIHPDVIALLRALMILSGSNKRNIRNNKIYGWARRRYSEMRKGAIPWNKDKSGTQVAWNKGISTPDEVCAKQAKRKMKQVSIMGVIYNSLADAALAHGFGENYNRVTNRCKSDLYPEWFFVSGIIEKRIRKGSPKGPMSEESKEKMRESCKGRIPWNKGKKNDKGNTA